jgi:hypothetical protein
MEGDTSQERIGEFLVKIGAMTADQRDEILKLQKQQPDRLFGTIAVEQGYINEQAIDAFLGRRN